MTKRELIKKFAQMESINLQDASFLVNTFFEVIKQALIEGKRVEIRGFGSFKVKHYGAYWGRNPKTGEPIRVPSKRLPLFKMGKEFKERLNKDE